MDNSIKLCCFVPEHLVCAYLNCTVPGLEGCISGYQVCSEDPGLSEEQANNRRKHFCISIDRKNVTTGELIPDLKRCLVGLSIGCSEQQCLSTPLRSFYSCCCNVSLCNLMSINQGRFVLNCVPLIIHLVFPLKYLSCNRETTQGDYSKTVKDT